ncbi:hypothetical protein ACQ4PT_001591 [Festuca glaucescens]
MPRQPAGSRPGGRAAKRRPRRRRLYIVTEDLFNGYSIHKVDLEEHYGFADPDTDEQEEQHDEERRLPPVVLRLEATNDGCRHFVAAFGTKIMALHQKTRRIPVFDVRTRCMSFGPRMPGLPIAPIYVPLGNKLFYLDLTDFEMLTAPPPPMDPSVPNFSHVVPKWPKWRHLRILPFSSHFVTSHAVHPDGQTIFVSVDVEGRDVGDTFTFDAAARPPKWRVHHGWQLPFKGAAYYDCELDAWVGLTNDPATLGHLCACEAPSTADVKWQPPSWKLSKEKLFCQGPDEKHTGATLVYLGVGYRSRFCLVQCLSHGERKRRLLRLTTFSLKYDKDGDLRTSTHRRVRTFKLPKAVSEDSAFLTNPMAFWL